MPTSKVTSRDAASASPETLSGNPIGKKLRTAAGGGRFLRSQAPPLFMLWLCLIVFPGVAAGQNKEACNLITKAELESITGFQFQPPQVIPAWNFNGRTVKADKDEKEFFASQETASSGCSYKLTPASLARTGAGADAVIQIGVRYLRDSDAEGLYARFQDLTGMSDLAGLTGPRFLYPSLWMSVDMTAVFFKETSGGTMLLEIKIPFVPKDVPASDYWGFLTETSKKIALKILGEASTLPGTPNEQIISSNDTLKGLNGIVVLVYLNNKLQSSTGLPNTNTFDKSFDEYPRLDMVNLLRENGIKVISVNNATSPPTLRLDINTRYVSQFNGPGFVVYTIELILLQTFPVQNQKPPARFVRVSTWSASSFGVNGSDRYRSEAIDLTSQFIKSYFKVNEKK